MSLVIRSRGLREQAFAKDATAIRWVLSLGSNKALEFLNAGSIDIGSTAGAAALIGRINGNPVKGVGVFSKLASGLALQKAGVVAAGTDVGATVAALLDTSFSRPSD